MFFARKSTYRGRFWGHKLILIPPPTLGSLNFVARQCLGLLNELDYNDLLLYKRKEKNFFVYVFMGYLSHRVHLWKEFCLEYSKSITIKTNFIMVVFLGICYVRILLNIS